MKKSINIIILVLIAHFVTAQSLQPIELVKRVVTDSLFIPQIPKFSTCEYKGRPNANDFTPNAKFSFKTLEANNETAVINVTILDSLGKGFDAYIHLKKEHEWKICAFRALAMTGILEKVLEQFDQMTEKQIDTLIAKGEGSIKSKGDLYNAMNNIKLTLDTDNNIIEHFEKNKALFNTMAQELSKAAIDYKKDEFRNIKLDEHISVNYKNLLIEAVSTSHYCDDCYKFTIGGMLDNTVGYLYIPNKKDVPKMQPNRLIMIRDIGNGWYLFKTT